MKLTLKHQRFLQEYVANGFNATRAYKLVYPKSSPDAARANASRMITSDSAKEFLEHETQRYTDAIEPTYKKLLNEFAKLAFSDIREVLDFETHGGPYLIPGTQLSAEAAACIQSVDVGHHHQNYRRAQVQGEGKGPKRACCSRASSATG